MAGTVHLERKQKSGLWDRRAIKAGYADWMDYWHMLENRASLTGIYATLTGLPLKPTAAGGYQGKCPFHDDRNPSFSILPGDRKFYCHSAGCGAKGSVFDFIRKIQGWTLAQATYWLAGELGIPRVHLPGVEDLGKSQTPSSGKGQLPLPQNVVRIEPDYGDPEEAPEESVPGPGETVQAWHPARKKWQSCRADHWHVYRTGHGRPVMLVGRIDAQGGIPKRFFRLTWRSLSQSPDVNNVGRGWVLVGWPVGVPAPLFGVERLAIHAGEVRNRLRDTLHVLVVEGEKACEAGHKLLRPDWCVMSASGGKNAVPRADWGMITRYWQEVDSLAGQPMRIVMWPDADPVIGKKDPAADFALGITEGLAKGFGNDQACRNRCLLSVVWPQPNWIKGFDLADLRIANDSSGWVRNQLARARSQYWPKEERE